MIANLNPDGTVKDAPVKGLKSGLGAENIF